MAAGLGRLDEARQLFYESIPLFEQIGDQNCLAFSHLYLADVEAQLGLTEGLTDLLAAATMGFISAAMYVMGSWLLVARYIRDRSWKDIFLVISIPILMVMILPILWITEFPDGRWIR